MHRQYNSEHEILNHLRALMHGFNATITRAFEEHGLQIVVALLNEAEQIDSDYCCWSGVPQIRLKLITDIA